MNLGESICSSFCSSMYCSSDEHIIIFRMMARTLSLSVELKSFMARWIALKTWNLHISMFAPGNTALIAFISAKSLSIMTVSIFSFTAILWETNTSRSFVTVSPVSLDTTAYATIWPEWLPSTVIKQNNGIFLAFILYVLSMNSKAGYFNRVHLISDVCKNMI